jgi:hypothetical protein
MFLEYARYMGDLDHLVSVVLRFNSLTTYPEQCQSDRPLGDESGV